MMTVITESGRRRAVEVVEVKLRVARGAYWCTWCDQHVDTKSRLRSGEVCCADPTPVFYDEVIEVDVQALVAFRPATLPEDREVLYVVGFSDGEEFVLTPDEQDLAANAASEEW